MMVRARAREQWKIGTEPLGARGREGVYVWLYDAFVQRGRFVHDMDLLLGVLYLGKRFTSRFRIRLWGWEWDHLANVHVCGRTDDVDFDVWSVLRMPQPT